ncbi:acyl carrier protein [Actinokineospora spheciospongiae]|uniref:acyl carrier protein n=1 Tax=Actinokineospora spheciospongiae TaxID=909613 RepID=UPI000D9E05EC|nr:acyl carrier protein [Actinokineospora spheciospongiae]PWW67063.1 acyl carrier protein [Actinokineospora spheciospongiae]
MSSQFSPQEVDGDVLRQVRAFFDTALPGNAIGADDDYFALGVVNSLMALEMVTHVERAFGLQVETEDLELDNFRTMNNMARFVERKLAAARG